MIGMVKWLGGSTGEKGCSSRRSGGRWKNGGLAGYPLSDSLAKGKPRDISPLASGHPHCPQSLR